MLIRLFLLLVTIPLLETVLLLLLADRLGFPLTFGMVVVSGVLGAWLLRRQGFRTITRIRREIAEGRVPAQDLLDGMFLVVGGVLLMTPGVFTDLVGIALLVPWTRTWIQAGVVRWFKSQWHLQVRSAGPAWDSSNRNSEAAGDSRVIDSHVVRRGDENQR